MTNRTITDAIKAHASDIKAATTDHEVEDLAHKIVQSILSAPGVEMRRRVRYPDGDYSSVSPFANVEHLAKSNDGVVQHQVSLPWEQA